MKPLLGLVCLFASLVSLRFSFGRPFLEIVFFDVGQGDSALVWTPDGKTVLVDAGGGFGDWDMGKRALRMELARMGIVSVDVVLVTHPDQDHGFGFRGVFDGMRVGEMWVNDSFLKETPRKPLMQDLLDWAKKDGTRVRAFVSPSKVSFGALEAELVPILNPDFETNNRPLLLTVRYGGRRLFFSADMEKEVEEWVLKRYEGNFTILKVPHHGSKTSSTPEFLRWARPEWAVISAGIGNHYGHPVSGIVARYVALGAKVLRTDFHGYVRFRIYENGEVRCETSLGSCGRLKPLP